MDQIIRSGIWAQKNAKTEEEANRAMAKTCFECDVKHVGRCYCDKGYVCFVERAHEDKMIELESQKK